MKKRVQIMIIGILAFALTGCGSVEEPEIGIVTEVTQPVETVETTVPPVETAAAAQTTEPAALHSPLYIEGVSPEQMVEYFCEVVLDTEYSTGAGDATMVQKWTAPIRYRIYGDATQEDFQLLERFFAELNAVDGFPGIYPVEEGEAENLYMTFCDLEEFNIAFGDFLNHEVADGAVQYWYYNDTNEIYSARIGYRLDIDQYTRNSVLLEEVLNGLGISDTILREDSISYQGFGQVQELSEVDWLILKLLYHPEIRCGMGKDACAEVIRRLYY